MNAIKQTLNQSLEDLTLLLKSIKLKNTQKNGQKRLLVVWIPKIAITIIIRRSVKNKNTRRLENVFLTKFL